MNFFKLIRQKFIRDNAFKKYIVYAIGEILLVMIGISLAFQVDNWNEDRINRNTEIQYYATIKDQILDDQELIQSQMDFNKRYIYQFRYAADIIEADDRSKKDTLGIIIRNMTQYSDFDRKGNIYETLVNSGEIKILRNQDIIKSIRELEEKYVYINRMESIHYDAMITHVVTSINPIIKYATGELKKPNAAYNFEFQNMFVVLMQIMSEKDRVYQKILSQIEDLKRLLNQEIDGS